MNEELTRLIVKELKKHREHNAIIEKVCERGGLNWKQAKQLILLIQAQQKRTVAVQQTPPLLFLSILALFFGLGLMALNIQMLMGLFQKGILQQATVLQGSDYTAIKMIVGLGMSICGVVGLWKAFGAIFPD